MSIEKREKDYQVKTVDEIKSRIAEILGYCRVDGGLHDPTNFNKRILRSKWRCPECNTVVGKVNYQRATELQWVLEGGSQSRKVKASAKETGPGEEGRDKDEESSIKDAVAEEEAA